MSHNPLLSHYKNATSISINLPSGNNYGGGIAFGQNGEVSIYPLSTKNEIFLNNPDHLASGEACVYMIENCCPSIKEINDLPYVDMEAISLAVKKITYGDNLKFNYECGKCKHVDSAEYSIDYIFSQMTTVPPQVHCSVDGLDIYLKPFTFDKFNEFKIIYTSETIAKNTILDETMSKEDAAAILYKAMETISVTSIDAIKHSIIRIITADGEEVTDQEMIIEFFDNAPIKIAKAIIEKHNEISTYGLPRTISLFCSNCNNEMVKEMAYDPSSFFE